MKTEYTPGPWTYKKNGAGYTIENEKRYVAYTATYGSVKVKENWDKANARLIATSPELLEACQSAISLLDLYREDKLVTDETIENVNGQNLIQVIEELRQAISKAISKS